MDIVSYVKMLPVKQFDEEPLKKELKALRKEYLLKIPKLDFTAAKFVYSESSVFSAHLAGGSSESFVHMAIPYHGSLEILEYIPSTNGAVVLEDYYLDDNRSVLVKEVRAVEKDAESLLKEEIRLLEEQYKSLTRMIWRENDLIDDFINEEVRKRVQNIRDNRDFVDGFAN